MADPKVIILTGASRGIGLSIAHYLLKASNKVVVISRTAEPLEKLKASYPGQVEFLAADLADFSVCVSFMRGSECCRIFGSVEQVLRPRHDIGLRFLVRYDPC